MIEVNRVTLGYRQRHGGKEVLRDLSFDWDKGELLCILGANGAGKTTLYRTMLGLLPVLKGKIMIDGQELHAYGAPVLAKKIAYVPQYHNPPFPYRVFDVVLMGRGAHISNIGTPSEEDCRIAQQMLERMGISGLRDEIYTQISGGERQLVLIARALTQQTDYLLMDEPTSNLDFGNQIRVLKEIRKLADEGMGICLTSHYPEHVLMLDREVLAIAGDGSYQKGPAAEVITEPLLQKMYGIQASIHSIRSRSGEMAKSILPEFGLISGNRG